MAKLCYQIIPFIPDVNGEFDISESVVFFGKIISEH
jgi:hypothetical protein